VGFRKSQDSLQDILLAMQACGTGVAVLAGRSPLGPRVKNAFGPSPRQAWRDLFCQALVAILDARLLACERGDVDPLATQAAPAWATSFFCDLGHIRERFRHAVSANLIQITSATHFNCADNHSRGTTTPAFFHFMVPAAGTIEKPSTDNRADLPFRSKSGSMQIGGRSAKGAGDRSDQIN